MSSNAVHRDPDAIEEEVVEVSGQHRARYQMLFSADRTKTDSLTCGIAIVRPGEPLPLHRHAHAEVYFALAGAALVTVDGKDHELAEGQAIFIPGNLEHAVHAETEARLFFAFAADSYQEVRYVYLDDD
ncbi:mannose-6-phosphate isomerase-like protein (cupin superfamily) [Limimaricola soesokkakensis]|uniref:Cupin domain protein n=1 Tax=Limimaricola soesokkakensis TaxID=1343159 RepID=A0A1X6YSY2_9RHOB|nr:cupin domain-containing protein [Limimaricola soesokkakensis]PSK87522.1 mannose-6-phosphate isomerase-like protein (cupin superfamily) [Limimaricola soesokkakensis]SLN30581.1 Cupin domain protein [Limimaricola soesokkakensis]